MKTDSSGHPYSVAEQNTAISSWFNKNGSRVPTGDEASSFIGSLLKRNEPVANVITPTIASFKQRPPADTFGYGDDEEDMTSTIASFKQRPPADTFGYVDDEEDDVEDMVREDPMTHYVPTSIGESATKGAAEQYSSSGSPSSVFGTTDPTKDACVLGSFKTSPGSRWVRSGSHRPHHRPAPDDESEKGGSSLTAILASMSLSPSEEKKESAAMVQGSIFKTATTKPSRPAKATSWTDKFKAGVFAHIASRQKHYNGLAIVFVPSEDALAKDMALSEDRGETADFVGAHVAKPLSAIKDKSKGNIVATLIRTDNGREWTLGATHADGLVLKAQQNFHSSRKLKGTDDRESLPGTSVDVKYCYLADDAGTIK